MKLGLKGQGVQKGRYGISSSARPTSGSTAGSPNSGMTTERRALWYCRPVILMLGQDRQEKAEVQGHPQLHGKSEARLSTLQPPLRILGTGILGKAFLGTHLQV